MNQDPNNQGYTLRVLLVEENFERAVMLKRALHEAGCHIAAHLAASSDLVGMVDRLKPDMIILDTESPDRDTLEHLCVISRDQPRPIVMFTNDGDRAKMQHAIRAGVSVYVVNGLKSERLSSIMDVAIVRFNELQSLRQDLAKAEIQLAERKDIERAKGILMKQRGWSEEESYQALRKMAMGKGIKLSEVARQIISVAELLV
ncbi:MAG: ANTAR domain-containing protein [Candidatus Nitrotoga sp.]